MTKITAVLQTPSLIQLSQAQPLFQDAYSGQSFEHRRVWIVERGNQCPESAEYALKN
ncbi:hypothetical protein ACFPCW_13970 [Vibrio thalassae]|uniref:hypothetical protein n=1 Tax=Vibrio thalassae TaxID=1243014 RepID=UPI003606C827